MTNLISFVSLGGLPFSMYAPRGGGRGGSRLLYISIAYYMQKGGEGVQIACKIAYILNGRPLEMSVYMIIRYTSKVIDKKTMRMWLLSGPS